MPEFVKRPVTVEAMQFDGENVDAIRAWAPDAALDHVNAGPGEPARPWSEGAFLWTHNGQSWGRLAVGDWVIREPDVSGYYPCTAANFEATYESIEGKGSEVAEAALMLCCAAARTLLDHSVPQRVDVAMRALTDDDGGDPCVMQIVMLPDESGICSMTGGAHSLSLAVDDPRSVLRFGQQAIAAAIETHVTWLDEKFALGSPGSIERVIGSLSESAPEVAASLGALQEAIERRRQEDGK